MVCVYYFVIFGYVHINCYLEISLWSEWSELCCAGGLVYQNTCVVLTFLPLTWESEKYYLASNYQLCWGPQIRPDWWNRSSISSPEVVTTYDPWRGQESREFHTIPASQTLILLSNTHLYFMCIYLYIFVFCASLRSVSQNRWHNILICSCCYHLMF